MNVAFSAVLLFILVLPGFLFRYTYARGGRRWDNPFAVQALSDEIPYSIFAAAVLHLVYASFIVHVLHIGIDLRSVFLLLIANFGKDSIALEHVVNSVVGHPYKIFFYFFILNLLSGGMGYLTHGFIRSRRWDIRYSSLRYNDEWYYLLKGEVLNFGRVERTEIAAVYLSAVVEQGSHCYLYRGEVIDWSYDRSGNLQWVVLRDAQRRLFGPDKDRKIPGEGSPGDPNYKADERFYPLLGHRFVLRLSEMSTLNLQFVPLVFSVVEVKADEPLV